MPTITLNTGESFEVDADTRLILALKDADVDILHRCGGYAKCTTCRVEFHEGEPDTMTQAEHDKLDDQDDLVDYRLSCQILCTHDMTVEPLMSLESTGLDDPGQRPKDDITPDPEWIDAPSA